MKLQGLSNEISLAKKAAKESGNLLISNKAKINYRVDSNPKDIKLKADIDSENLIKTIISNESTFPILAEESGKSKEELGNVFWVIDPLDGTANFSRDIPICCISIGLIMSLRLKIQEEILFLKKKKLMFSNLYFLNGIPTKLRFPTINILLKSSLKVFGSSKY